MITRQQLTIRKMNLAGETELTWQGEVLDDTTSWVKLEARFDRYDRLELGYAVFERGDRFIEWFFKDRWYTIYEIYSRANNILKGWYCNITMPAEIIGNEVRTVDLALDLWVGPDGAMTVLDKHEFESLEMSHADRDKACAAMEELEQMVRSRRSPFHKTGQVHTTLTLP